MRPMDDARQRMQRLVGRAWDEAKSPLYRNAFYIMLASLIGSLALLLPAACVVVADVRTPAPT